MSTSPPSSGARLRLLHLVGSEVDPFFADLSRLYAEDCLRATADPERYDVHVAHVEPGGRWRFPRDLSAAAIDEAEAVPLDEAVRRIVGLAPDAMVPQMFCLPGMTTYRGLFDLLGIPYLGNAPETMALAAHKARAKAVVAAAGVRVPHGELLRPGETPTIGVPAVVKPADADNSSGVTLVRDAADLDAALREAFAHSGEVLVEEYVELGREVRCGTVEVDGELVGLPLEEYAVDTEAKPIRGYADKLRRTDDGTLNLVAKDAEHAWILDPADPLTARVQAVSRACHRALGCRDYSLFDFRVDADGEPWFLEAGLYCSFAEKSVVAVMARAAGRELPDLFAACLDQALARRAPSPSTDR